MKEDRRKNERLLTEKCYAHFSEGDSCYTGVIEDVSASGLRVRLCPFTSKFMSGEAVSWFQGTLIRTSSKYIITISESPDINDLTSNSFTLNAHPRWRKREGGMMIIGFHIAEPPTGWEQFIEEEITLSPELEFA